MQETFVLPVTGSVREKNKQTTPTKQEQVKKGEVLYMTATTLGGLDRPVTPERS